MHARPMQRRIPPRPPARGRAFPIPRLPLRVLATLAAVLVTTPGAAQTGAGPRPAGAGVDGQALIGRYCVTCHNDRLETGGFSFDPLDAADVAAHPEAWEKVVRKLRAGAMPPRPRPRPGRETYDGFRAWLEGELDAAAAADPNPGRTETFHRLSRTEYRNAVRDLLALEVGVEDLLPADDTSYGFDNIAGVLGVSPTLMERYLSAARRISRLAVASPVPSPTAETFRIASDLGQDRRMERLPFGTRGGMVVDYNFPEDAEYVFEILPDGPLRIEPHDLELAIDGERIALLTVGKAPDPDDPRGLYTPRVEALEVRAPVTAGPHEVGVAFLRKTAAEPEGIRKLYLRPFTGEGSGGDSRYQPYVESVTIAGPYESSGARPVAGTPSRERIFNAVRRAAPPRKRPPARARSCRRWRGGRTAGPSPARTWSGFWPSTTGAARRAASTPASRWRSGGCWSVPSSCSGSSATRKASRPGRSTASAAWSWRPGCRSSSGAAFRTTSCWRRRSAGSWTTRRSSRRRWSACSPTRARRPWWTTSPGSG